MHQNSQLVSWYKVPAVADRRMNHSGMTGRLLPTTIGSATMTAFCYSVETVYVFKTRRCDAQQAFQEQLPRVPANF